MYPFHTFNNIFNKTLILMRAPLPHFHKPFKPPRGPVHFPILHFFVKYLINFLYSCIYSGRMI